MATDVKMRAWPASLTHERLRAQRGRNVELVRGRDPCNQNQQLAGEGLDLALYGREVRTCEGCPS